LFIPKIRKIEAEQTLFIPQIGKIEAKPSLFIPQIQKIGAELYRLHTAFLHWPLSSAATKKVQGPDTT
jgi:hypothetical protein